MILLIDNYDSFTYNIYQYVASLGHKIRVVRNDKNYLAGNCRWWLYGDYNFSGAGNT